eukprot:TRINITY_DN24105_c0_g1_i1.p1 TRINITY_DN24105_c0_g1~~TRINITY_DN24105_c0_g1_i1.p1  ORF type:complete len:602 (-),score=116.54 TRINITY_DN24105_c0_g1_i1:136-1941(-)
MDCAPNALHDGVSLAVHTDPPVPHTDHELTKMEPSVQTDVPADVSTVEPSMETHPNFCAEFEACTDSRSSCNESIGPENKRRNFAWSVRDKADPAVGSKSGGDASKVEVSRDKAVFVDASELKKKVLENLCKPQYNVHDMYHDTGIAQAIAKNNFFENGITLSIISLNALWIAIDTDYNEEPVLLKARPVFQVAEHFFCVFFTFEISVRFFAFKVKLHSVRDNWFAFDSVLVTLMVAETWVMTAVVMLMGGGAGLRNAQLLRLLRLLRLSRLARMARILRSMPELMILIKGMAVACRSVFFTLILLFLIIYIFSIVFTQMSSDAPSLQGHFGEVSTSMYTLLLSGALLDNVGKVAGLVGEQSFGLAFLFFFFILLASFTILNMLIGVLCEVVSAVAAVEREEMTIGKVKNELQQIVEALDQNGDASISRDEFMRIIENPVAAAHLVAVGVDVIGLIDFADFIFDHEDASKEIELSFADFLEVVLSLRGSNNSTVKDIVDIRKFIHRNHKVCLQRVDKVEDKLSKVVTGLNEVEEGSRRDTDQIVSHLVRLEQTLLSTLGGKASDTCTRRHRLSTTPLPTQAVKGGDAANSRPQSPRPSELQ